MKLAIGMLLFSLTAAHAQTVVTTVPIKPTDTNIVWLPTGFPARDQYPVPIDSEEQQLREQYARLLDLLKPLEVEGAK